MRKAYLVYLLFASLCLSSGCSKYYLSLDQRWIDTLYLASSHVATPDPRQAHPPLGQMLIMNWRVPKEILEQNPSVVLDIILWDYTTRQERFPIHHQMDFTAYKLLNEEYEKSGGILTYKAQIVTEDGQVFRQWRHQLWVNLITVSDTQEGTD